MSKHTRIGSREYWLGASRGIRGRNGKGFAGLSWYAYNGHALNVWCGISGLLVLSFWTFRFK